MSILAMVHFNEFKRKYPTLINQLEDLIKGMPQNGDTEGECQKVCIINSIKGLEADFNDTTVKDFEKL